MRKGRRAAVIVANNAASSGHGVGGHNWHACATKASVVQVWRVSLKSAAAEFEVRKDVVAPVTVLDDQYGAYSATRC